MTKTQYSWDFSRSDECVWDNPKIPSRKRWVGPQSWPLDFSLKSVADIAFLSPWCTRRGIFEINIKSRTELTPAWGALLFHLPFIKTRSRYWVITKNVLFFFSPHTHIKLRNVGRRGKKMGVFNPSARLSEATPPPKAGWGLLRHLGEGSRRHPQLRSPDSARMPPWPPSCFHFRQSKHV